jgi:antitoxin component of RelBE/YafQ-DinJ toxin-antitoxin module
MNNDIQKAIELYDLMSSRLERSKMAAHQSRVYREIGDLIRDCTTLEEVQEKIKGSRYYTAPTIALFKDRLAAQKKAADENGMPDLAAVYADKLREIEADESAVYKTGYEQKAADIWRRHGIKASAFVKIFNHYCAMAAAIPFGTEIASDHLELVAAFEEMESVGADFATLAADPKFRSLVNAADGGYREFVREAPRFRSNAPDLSAEKEGVESELNAIWASIKANEQSIKAIGKRCRERTKRAQCIVIPPGSADGEYEYTDVFEEAF